MGEFRRLYPPQEAILFDGGLDNKFEKALLPDNESPDCLNVEFVNGSVGTRQGAVKLNTAPAASGTVAFDAIYTRHGNDGVTESMCAFIGGHMLVLGATTFNTVPSAQSVFTIGVRVGAAEQENHLFIGNGSVGPYKYNGTDFTQHGISAPVATAAVASGTTGSLNSGGVYMYKYTNVNSALVESNLSPATAAWTVSGVGKSIMLTSIAVGTAPSQGVAQRWLYRTLDGGSSYFRVVKLNDNTTTTYTDTTADVNLGSPAPTDNGTPPKYSVIYFLAGMLFCNDANNPNYVWYSVPGQPYTYPSTQFFKVGDNSSDLVKGFGDFGGSLIVFCEQSVIVNYMPDPATPSGWTRIKINSPYGSKSPFSMLKCTVRGQDYLMYPALQNRVFAGFGALSGATVALDQTITPIGAMGSDLQSQRIETDMFLLPSTYVSNISGIVFKNRAFVSVTYGTNAAINNRIYVWDFSLSTLSKDQIASWVPWSGTGHSIVQFCIYGGHVYGASSTTNGFVYRLIDTGVFSDDGAAINSYWWSKEYPGFSEDTAISKDFRYLNLLYDNAGSYSMGILSRTDSDIGTGNPQAINLTSGASLWGTMIWGTNTWGGGVNQTEGRIYLGPTRGKRLQFQFNNQNTVNQRFKVHRGQIAYNLKGYR